jgi:hypothetical protein
MKPVAMTATLPIFTPKTVSVLFTASMTVSDHWSDKFARLAYQGRPLVKTIMQSYLCKSCARKGIRSVCIHRKHLMPAHIEGTEGNAISQMMNLISDGSYQLEVLGIADFLRNTTERLFNEATLNHLFEECVVTLANSDLVDRSSTLFYVIDPTPSEVSGIGLAGGIVLDGERRLVSIGIFLLFFKRLQYIETRRLVVSSHVIPTLGTVRNEILVADGTLRVTRALTRSTE